MAKYLEFKNSMCKDCYKCLRNCPVKAIKVVNHQAKIIEERCILCGKCTTVCPQNAKSVHSEIDEITELLANNKEVIASIAPSFVSSFKIQDFLIMASALKKLGFSYAEETAVGARIVTEQYKELLLNNKYKNFITSSCPAVNEMIQMYYPKALPYLAPIDSPMIAHAKILKSVYPKAKIIFIGPCIAKKKEAFKSNIIDGVLTFEDLEKMFKLNDIKLSEITIDDDESNKINKAKYYPISRGIIKSFDKYVDGYEFVAVDGIAKCKEVLENIDSLDGMFLELNSCEYACVNGPCSLIKEGTAVAANAEIRQYANRGHNSVDSSDMVDLTKLNFYHLHQYQKPVEYTPTEDEIRAILAKTGKFKPEDELNCGACGYNSCRDKAWAVANGYAAIEMCIPYMRERAESMSYEIIQNSPNGIVLIDNDLKIIEINGKAISLLGIENHVAQGNNIYDYFDASDFMKAQIEKQNIYRKKVFISKTNVYVELSIVQLQKENVLFGVFKDITDETNYNDRLIEMKLKTLRTTDEVIKKQMRVAQEIASLLGETTAETKVALVKLKHTLQSDEEK